MPFGFDDIFFALAAANAANSLANPPKGPDNKVAASAAPTPQQGPNAFALPMPAGAPPTQAVNIDDEVFNEAAKKAAAITQGPPPTVPLMGPPAPPVGPPAPASPGVPATTAPVTPSIGEVLAATPSALANVAHLLGIGQDQGTREIPAPIPGGTAGRVVEGFALPQQMNLGAILSQIPRFR